MVSEPNRPNYYSKQNPASFIKLFWNSVSINYSVFQVFLSFQEQGDLKIVSILNIFTYEFFVFIEYSSV